MQIDYLSLKENIMGLEHFTRDSQDVFTDIISDISTDNVSRLGTISIVVE